MSYSVFLTDDAAADLEELYDYLVIHTVDDRADVARFACFCNQNSENGVFD